MTGWFPLRTIRAVPLPPAEPLYETLIALRDAEDPTDPKHAAAWRRVSDWLGQAFPGRTPEAEDARQETMVSLLRHVSRMRAEAPLQAAKWVGTIHRRKRVDALRARRNDPVREALRMEPRRATAVTSELERVEADDGPVLTPELLEEIVATVLGHVQRALEETVKNPQKRLLRRVQAQATLLRLVCGWEAERIVDALDHGEPVGKDRLYKWVERGRDPVRLGLERWRRVVDAPERVETDLVVEVLLELVDERRADAGVPRLERRKDRPEDPP